MGVIAHPFGVKLYRQNTDCKLNTKFFRLVYYGDFLDIMYCKEKQMFCTIMVSSNLSIKLIVLVAKIVWIIWILKSIASIEKAFEINKGKK